MEAVGLDIGRLQVHVDGNGDGGLLEDGQEILAQQARHLILPLLAGDVVRGPYAGDGRYLGLVAKRLLFRHLLFQEHIDLEILLEIVSNLPGIDDQKGAHSHQKQDQG